MRGGGVPREGVMGGVWRVCGCVCVEGVWEVEGVWKVWGGGVRGRVHDRYNYKVV